MLTKENALGELRLWLLGLLPEQESRAFEERLITDNELYEEVFIVEEELIDDYIAGRLSSDERAAFESYFMNSPERQEQFRIANALRAYIGDAKETEPVADVRPRWSIRAIALIAASLVIAVLIWKAVDPRPPVSTVTSLSFVLTPGGQTREGGTVQTIAIPSGPDSIDLDLKLTRHDYQEYRATLLNSEGGTVQITDNLTGPTPRVPVRTQQLPPGEYQLKVDGLTADGRYESADSYRFLVAKP